ncbi:MAG: DNA gyrase/topoisomerase IV subunit A [Saprospiraceae bacterium]|nr:DNA gyrase/topoisomerase IV subunit A [Saprospiraceae bacterium]
MARKKPPVTDVPEGDVHSLKGMYRDYFLDYASYVILERAVPAVEDGLKPVQRRILHSLKEKDDGRYHKVANIIGHTMQYHPHGDAAIGDALVNLGQKELLIDTQGNWGDVRTGDRAAAPRYIEARLTKFALEVAFNAQTTEWQLSYDGRKNEPVALPMKFPLLLAQGAEGIAVGLSTRILPHNFIELIKASIKALQGKRFKIYPDFQTGGMVDVTEYQAGKRGGKVRVRARIEQVNKKTLAIRELPYGVTTTSLIDSIVKANDKGKIKIKKLVDNTAKDVEILIELASGVSPDVTMDALYAFTHCEVSISPNACVIVENKPHFLNVDDILRISAERTKELLRQELEIRKHELDEKWHFSSLEKIFIEKRIYRDIEECESWEEVLTAIRSGLEQYVATPATQKKGDTRLLLQREITEEDIAKLTEIRIKRISRYNVLKADELIRGIEEELANVHYDLKHLTDYAVKYFERLLEKYADGRERRTEITEFDTIKAVQVIANNAKLYVNRKEGFVGHGLKKDEFIMDCSDLDDIIAIRKDGKFMVSRIADKTFMGKDILHVAVWKKGDDRTTYNMMYVDKKSGRTMAKRFNIARITRDKEYDLTAGAPGSRVHYLEVHPNGESEVVEVQLTPGCRAKKKVFDFDFGELSIKGRGSKGNIVTRYPVRKVVQKELGKSTLGAMRLWIDEVSGRINTEERGKYLGEFDTGDLIISLYQDGSYQLNEIDPNLKLEAKELCFVGKYQEEMVISALYYEGEKGWTMVKRFNIETNTTEQRFPFITDHRSSKLYYATGDDQTTVTYGFKSKNKKQTDTVDLAEFIDVKGWKALGNKLTDKKLISVEPEVPEGAEKPEPAASETAAEAPAGKPAEKPAEKPAARTTRKKSKPKKGDDKGQNGTLFTGDTIEFDL